jgi:protein-L-isoaspartate(D-aspartate) O-methyltransferase
MTELLEPGRRDCVLEIGTGSGYQAAMLSTLVAHVYTIEIVAELAQSARNRLASLGYTNVTVRQGDGYLGWPEHAPFDRILVTAAPPELPPTLLSQLKPGGRLVAPWGRPIRADTDGGGQSSRRHDPPASRCTREVRADGIGPAG